ncbi:MAG: class I SAM-dependent methyltransferase [Flavobacteriales bacterium]
MNTETEKIKERYAKRAASETVLKHSQSAVYNEFSREEKERVFERFIRQYVGDPEKLSVLEIGAGGGINISFFKNIGVPAHQIFGNELLAERVEDLQLRHPDIHIIAGDALQIDENTFGKMDVIFQSTVFTSILDDGFKSKLAEKMKALLKPNGMVLWYDFVYNNPSNKDVKGVPVAEVRTLFPDFDFHFEKVTLAPPIGRRVGSMYPLFNALPFLRTHVVGAGIRL